LIARGPRRVATAARYGTAPFGEVSEGLTGKKGGEVGKDSKKEISNRRIVRFLS
jgi:hypothetical protein